jgi:geranylgeranyl pyrophosphate synthase
MDEDDFRRGQPGINKKLRDFFLSNFKEEEYKGTLFNKKSSRFTVSTALMLGNICNILSKKAILDSDFDNDVKIKALKVIEDADEKICQGQMLDILMEHKAATEIEYFDMIKNKTAEFFGMCFELGAVFAGADDKRHMYKQVGINSAIAFQIQDDIIDVLGNKGHEFGSDIKKGKKTLLMIKTLEKANDDQKRFIMKIIGKAASDEDIKKVVKIMHDTGAINYCRRLIKQYSEKAKESGILRELVDVMINRDS